MGHPSVSSCWQVGSAFFPEGGVGGSPGCEAGFMLNLSFCFTPRWLCAPRVWSWPSWTRTCRRIGFCGCGWGAPAWRPCSDYACWRWWSQWWTFCSPRRPPWPPSPPSVLWAVLARRGTAPLCCRYCRALRTLKRNREVFIATCAGQGGGIGMAFILEHTCKHFFAGCVCCLQIQKDAYRRRQKTHQLLL